MNLIVNADCEALPHGATEYAAYGTALLNLVHCLDFDKDNPPLAQVLSRQYQLEGDWVILSPAQWQATHNNVVVSALNHESGVDVAELKRGFECLSEYFIARGMVLYYHDPYTWLLSTGHQSVLHAKPVYSVSQKLIMQELIDMDETLYWQKVLTECQMFLATQQLNSLINGVWIWGSGRIENKKRATVCADPYYFSMASIGATEVFLYQEDCSLSDFDLIIMNDLTTLSTTHRAQLDNSAVFWYWNNLSYQTYRIPSRWWARLWRTFIHANKTTPVTKS